MVLLDATPKLAGPRNCCNETVTICSGPNKYAYVHMQKHEKQLETCSWAQKMHAWSMRHRRLNSPVPPSSHSLHVCLLDSLQRIQYGPVKTQSQWKRYAQ